MHAGLFLLAMPITIIGTILAEDMSAHQAETDAEERAQYEAQQRKLRAARRKKAVGKRPVRGKVTGRKGTYGKARQRMSISFRGTSAVTEIPNDQDLLKVFVAISQSASHLGQLALSMEELLSSVSDAAPRISEVELGANDPKFLLSGGADAQVSAPMSATSTKDKDLISSTEGFSLTTSESGLRSLVVPKKEAKVDDTPADEAKSGAELPGQVSDHSQPQDSTD